MLNETLYFLDSLYSPVVGPTIAEVITAAIVILSSFILAKIVNFILRRFLKGLTAKTKSQLDDLIVAAISLPIILGIVVAGIFIALQGLPGLAPFEFYINGGFTVFYILFAALIAIRIINAFVYWYAMEVSGAR